LTNNKAIQILHKQKKRLNYPNSETNVVVWTDSWKKEDKRFGNTEPPEPTQMLRQHWKREQFRLSQLLKIENDFSWNLDPSSANCLKYIGGVDISFAKKSKIDACASIIICEYPSCKVVFETYRMVKLTEPYIAGFLAFREVPFIVEIIDRLKSQYPQYLPQILMVDGNGILHMRGFGQACHLGVLTDIPCFGVAKQLLFAKGITDVTVEEAFRRSSTLIDTRENRFCGRSAFLIGDNDEKVAIALEVPGEDTLYISPGHKIGLNTCLELVKHCMKGNKLPEPVYQADYLSREFLSRNYRFL